MSVQSRSDNVNTSLFDKREHIEKLHRTCNLLRKVQVLNQLSISLFIEYLGFHVSNVMEVEVLQMGRTMKDLLLQRGPLLNDSSISLYA